MKVDVIFPSLDSTSISIIQMAGLQFFTFLINDQIVDMMGAYFIDEFYSLPFQTLSIVRLYHII